MTPTILHPRQSPTPSPQPNNPNSVQFLVLLAPIFIIASLTLLVLCLRSCYVGHRRKRLAETRIAVEPWNKAWFVADAPPDEATIALALQWSQEHEDVDEPPTQENSNENQVVEEQPTVTLTAAQQIRVMAALDSAEREDSDYIEPLQFTTLQLQQREALRTEQYYRSRGLLSGRPDMTMTRTIPTTPPPPSTIAASPLPIVAMNRYISLWAARCNYAGTYSEGQEHGNYALYYLAHQRFLPTQLNTDLPPATSAIFLNDITGVDARIWAHIYRPRSGGGAVVVHGGNEAMQTFGQDNILLRTPQTITWRKRRERCIVAALGLRPRSASLQRIEPHHPLQDPLIGTYFEVLLSVWGPPPTAEDLAIQESLQEARLEAMDRDWRREMQQYEERSRLGVDSVTQTNDEEARGDARMEKSEYQPGQPVQTMGRRRTILFEPPPPYDFDIPVQAPASPTISPPSPAPPPVSDIQEEHHEQHTLSLHHLFEALEHHQEKKPTQTFVIGLTTRPYPPFLLPGRFATSVALVIDDGVHLVISRPTKKGKENNTEYVNLSSEYIDARWRCPAITAGDVLGCGLTQRGQSWCVYFTLNSKPIILYPNPTVSTESIPLETRGALDSRHLIPIEIGTIHGGPAQLFPALGSRGHVTVLSNFSGPFLFPFSPSPQDDDSWIRDMCLIEEL